MLKYLFDECTVYSKLSFIEKCSFIGNKLKLLFFLCYVIRILYLLQKTNVLTALIGRLFQQKINKIMQT